MALGKVRTNAGQTNGKSRWTRRAEVKAAAKKARRTEAKKAVAEIG